jgi:uncharacterized membrane protein
MAVKQLYALAGQSYDYPMLKKISLSAMAFTYLFAGLAHFLKTDYYLSFIPSFIPQSRLLVLLSGAAQIILAVLLAFPKTRRGVCYGILLLWSISLPINVYTVSTGGAGTPFTPWQLATLIPFHLLLMLWAFWHSQEPAGPRRLPVARRGIKIMKPTNGQ